MCLVGVVCGWFWQGLRYGVCYLFIPVKVVKHVFCRISRTVVDCAPSIVPVGITRVLGVVGNV